MNPTNEAYRFSRYVRPAARLSGGLLAAACLLGAGCAGPGAEPTAGASTKSATELGAGAAAATDFYQDWYDPAAVVLPPPPVDDARR